MAKEKGGQRKGYPKKRVAEVKGAPRKGWPKERVPQGKGAQRIVCRKVPLTK